LTAALTDDKQHLLTIQCARRLCDDSTLHCTVGNVLKLHSHPIHLHPIHLHPNRSHQQLLCFPLILAASCKQDPV